MTQQIQKMITRNLEDALTLMNTVQFGIAPDEALQREVERLKISNNALKLRNVAMREILENVSSQVKFNTPLANKIKAMLESGE